MRVPAGAPSAVESAVREGENPVWAAAGTPAPGKESGCLGLQSKAGGRLHLRLNIDKRPIANKYREGKMKSTLKKESKGREIADMEAIGAAEPGVYLRPSWWRCRPSRAGVRPASFGRGCCLDSILFWGAGLG